MGPTDFLKFPSWIFTLKRFSVYNYLQVSLEEVACKNNTWFLKFCVFKSKVAKLQNLIHVESSTFSIVVNILFLFCLEMVFWNRFSFSNFCLNRISKKKLFLLWSSFVMLFYRDKRHLLNIQLTLLNSNLYY